MRILYLSIIYLCWVFLLFFPERSYSQGESPVRPKVGVVLSGGGAKGIAHVGFLKVMEEAGIRPDFIGGTSMGSIIGGLYAIGYTVDELEDIALNMDWNYYLSDEIPRQNITLEEKSDHDRFFVSFPITERRINIPSGIINGQNIENKLNALCAPVYNIHSFNEFHIPYLCIAADIETGEEVVFTEGSLPEAMRASMAIPSIFNPVNIDGRLLVDGGIVNNFPAMRVKEMGADIIIGVDVGFQYYEKEELNSLFRILEQTILFIGEDLNNQNKSVCDILIIPRLKGYNASSFNSADTILSIGEAAAREHFPQMKALADSIRKFDPSYGPSQNLASLDSIYIKEIRINGLKKVSGKLLAGKLQLEALQSYTVNDIASSVDRAYSSLYFNKISWNLSELEPAGARLNFDVEESQGGLFRLGLHYDSNYKASLLFNTTFRNILMEGSKLSSNLALGENPFLNFSYFKNNGWKPGLGINMDYSNFDVFVYNTEGRKLSNLKYSEGSIQLFTQSIIRNSHALGVGTEIERTVLKPRIDPSFNFDQTRQTFFNHYGFMEIDSYDDAFFPTQGLKLYSELKIVTQRKFDPVIFYSTRFSKASALSKKVSLHTNLYGGFAEGDSIPYQYNFYTGGMNPIRRNGLFPFVGLDFMERANKNALILRADLQIEIFRNFYITARGNAGNLKSSFRDLFTTNDMIGGYGLTLSYNSWIGPIEYTFMKPANRKGTLYFVNIGYWF